MPLYLYRCPNCGNEEYRQHAMDYAHGVVCQRCHSWMAKRPQTITVNWNGNKPSDGGVTDYVRQLEADAPRIRDGLTEKRNERA